MLTSSKIKSVEKKEKKAKMYEKTSHFQVCQNAFTAENHNHIMFDVIFFYDEIDLYTNAEC